MPRCPSPFQRSIPGASTLETDIEIAAAEFFLGYNMCIIVEPNNMVIFIGIIT